jgi:hypothetical protein
MEHSVEFEIRSRVGLLVLSCGMLVSCAGGASNQVAPGPAAPWRAPDLRQYVSALKPAEQPPIDPARQYDLPELIDVAQRVNPETRIAWERARQGAIAVGLVESEYFPTLALSAFGGYQSLPLPAPQNLIPQGFFRIDVVNLLPGLNLTSESNFSCRPATRCYSFAAHSSSGSMRSKKSRAQSVDVWHTGILRPRRH